MHRKIMGLRKLAPIMIVLVIALVLLGVYNQKISTQVGTLISAITFIYGFFINSIIKFSEAKYLNFKTSLGDISAYIQTLYNLVMLSGQERFKSDMKKKLTGFIKALEHLDSQSYYLHQNDVNRLFSFLKKLELKTKFEEVILSRMINALLGISLARERMEIYSEKYLVRENKFTFVVLTSLVIASVILIALGNTLLMVLGIILILGLIVTSYLIFDLDNLQYGELKKKNQNLDKLLDFIEEN